MYEAERSEPQPSEAASERVKRGAPQPSEHDDDDECFVLMAMRCGGQCRTCALF